jgi:trimethylamine--corrinoid protein Co-methyltransferase
MKSSSKMNRAIINFEQKTLDSIHKHSIELLRSTGIKFPCEKALDIFKHHGFRTASDVVYFKEKDIHNAMESVPATFAIKARNPAKNIQIGDNNFVLAPGYGPPFIIDPSGEMRDAGLEDVQNFCKLVQTSKYLDFNSSMVVQPADVPQDTAHLDILLSTMLLTDKPIMGSSVSKAAAVDSLKMAQMVWGRTMDPVMISLVDSLAPLQYAAEMVDAILVFAAAGQPLIIHSACTLGTTGPITIAGSLVISNATTLAGICLAQLVNPGTPIVYGLGGSPTEMKSGGYVNGSPEDANHTAIAAAMGQYYNIPCRSQGALTESFCLDYQAGMESAMMLTTAALSGVHLCLHACGTYGSMIAMSYEKFIADEDLCGALKKLIKPVEFTDDAFAMEMIKELGTSANYMLQLHTVDRCRTEFFRPDLSNQQIHSEWFEMEHRDLTLRAGVLLKKRLAGYTMPEIGPQLEKDLSQYVNEQKRNT